MKTMSRNQCPQGFSLIELLVAIVVLAVVVALAAPNFKTLVLGNRRTIATNELVRAFHIARDGALTRGFPVTVLAIDATDSSNEWGAGWTVFVDNNADGALDITEEILMQDFVVPDGVKLDDLNGVSFVQYRPAGNTSLSPVPHMFKACSTEQEEQGRQITISPIGQVSSMAATCS